MPELRLQDYVTKIKDLVQNNRSDEAIAHCQHILRHHSKHIETYRLLGEACLEKGAFREAIEFFQRTLSADPESFLARVGLGVVYSEQGALPGAIWQMERAFELAPGNAEVRRQLQRLYAQRDGEGKARLRLTQGALGRLYSRNGLYERAIGEFRAVLEQDPDLPDVQIALAEALWREGRRLEAVETCLALVDALPHCLKANLILGEVWTKGGHEDAGEERLQVAQALDPENWVAQEMMGQDSPLPPREVLIPQLEVVPRPMVPMIAVPPAEREGAEAELAGLAGEEWAEEEEEIVELPEWMEEEVMVAEEDLVPEEEAMLAVLEEEEAPPEEGVPAWLRDLMGEGPPSEAEPKRPFLEEPGVPEAGLPPAEEESLELAVGEEPDWLADLGAPTGIAEEGALVTPEGEVPDSLRALVEAGILDESDLAVAMAEMSEEELAAQQAEEVPEWLRDLIGEEAPAAEPAAEAWEEAGIVAPVEEAPVMAGAAAEEREGEEVPKEAEAEELPQWLKELGVSTVEAVPWEEEVMPEAEVFEEAAPIVEAEAEAEAKVEAEAEELPQWLKDLGGPAVEAVPWEEEVVPEEEVFEEEAPEVQAEAEAEAKVEAEAEELPWWLKELEGMGVEGVAAPLQAAATTVESVAEVAEVPEAEEPSWAPSAGIEEGDMVPPQEGVPESLRALVEAGILDESDVASAMAEMSTEELAAQQAEEVPAWLRDLVGEEELEAEMPPVPAPVEEVMKPPLPEEMPRWLREAVGDREEMGAPPVEEAAALEETILEPSAAAEVPEEAVEPKGQVPVPVEEEEEEPAIEEAPVLEEIVLEPPTAEPMEEAQVRVAEEEAAEPLAAVPQMPEAEMEAEAAPSVAMEMVAPYDRVEIEEDVPVRRRIDDLVQRLKANPRDYPLRLELARLYREERDWNAALTNYQNLISARKFLPAILDDLDLMLKREVEPARVYQLMGDAYLQENALDKALQMYRQAQQALTKR